MTKDVYKRQEQPQTSVESPAFHSETVAVYPGDKNHLPYDVVVERLHIEEPEPPAPATEPEKTFEEVLDEHPVSIQVNGQWQTFHHAKAAEEASSEEYKANLDVYKRQLHYKSLFSDCDVIGLDYTAQFPWEAKEEFRCV